MFQIEARGKDLEPTERVWAAPGRGITQMRQIPWAEDTCQGGAQLRVFSGQHSGYLGE